MKNLWSFEDQAKLELFTAVLDAHGIEYEVPPKSERKAAANGIPLAVEDREYEKAKKLLLKHRKRRTSTDLLR